MEDDVFGVEKTRSDNLKLFIDLIRGEEDNDYAFIISQLFDIFRGVFSESLIKIIMGYSRPVYIFRELRFSGENEIPLVSLTTISKDSREISTIRDVIGMMNAKFVQERDILLKTFSVQARRLSISSSSSSSDYESKKRRSKKRRSKKRRSKKRSTKGCGGGYKSKKVSKKGCGVGKSNRSLADRKRNDRGY